MVIYHGEKALHYYKYKEEIIIERLDLCMLLEPNNFKALSQKLSLNLNRNTEQLVFNKADFGSIPELEVTNKFVTVLSFVTLKGLKKIFEDDNFRGRAFDEGSIKFVKEMFLQEPKVDAIEQATVEIIAAAVEAQPIKRDIKEEEEKINNTTYSSIAEYVLAPDIIKAIKLKAVNEDKLEDDVVENILRANIEKKYFSL